MNGFLAQNLNKCHLEAIKNLNKCILWIEKKRNKCYCVFVWMAKETHKHGGTQMIRIEGIYDEIPSQLRNPKRHFKLSAVEDGARFSEFRDPLFWLADAMIVNNRENRMEIDFLISKKTITNRHNISPIEVKSSKNYTLSSLRKFIAKYGAQLHIPYVIHAGDLKKEEGITFLPLYMTSFI